MNGGGHVPYPLQPRFRQWAYRTVAQRMYQARCGCDQETGYYCARCERWGGDGVNELIDRLAVWLAWRDSVAPKYIPTKQEIYRRVACPTCKAKPGEQCTRQVFGAFHREVAPTHKTRMRAAT